ncbi:MAG: helix-turn-helix domain-containing protein [Verrucomicrobia bacterium]|nr:helix-turn-helix domain-containing protein [Verrucomicrobiota bacterium]
MSAVAARIRKAAAQSTQELPFRFPIAQEWFTLRQAAAVLGLTESTIERLYDRGELTGHSHNAGRGERDHKRVLRASLLAYALRTADYDDASLDDAFLAALTPLSAARLLNLADRIRQLATAGTPFSGATATKSASAVSAARG